VHHLNAFAILDVYNGYLDYNYNIIQQFRDGIGNDYLENGAAYYSWAEATLRENPKPEHHIKNWKRWRKKNPNINLKDIQEVLIKQLSLVPPSGIVAGKYMETQRTKGVWKAPAGVEAKVKGISKVTPHIDLIRFNSMNIGSDKYINNLFTLATQDKVLWGSVTLNKHSDWSYISERLFIKMLKRAIQPYFNQKAQEGNVPNTWQEIKSDVEILLNKFYKKGTFAGEKTKDAYFVKIGLGETMTQKDIDEQRMIIEIGMAMTSPASFKILRLKQTVY
jgi:phage tail sheath protein FI